MSIKGFPTQQKLVSGQSSRADFVTVQPTADFRNAVDSVGRMSFRVGSPTIPRTAGPLTGNANDSYGTWIDDTATPAMVGDFVRFKTGVGQFLEVPIVDIDSLGNGFRLGGRLPAAVVPAPGDTFFIQRYSTPLTDDQGFLQVSIAPSPIAYVLDTNPTQVNHDTLVPANNRALPVKPLAIPITFGSIDAFVANIAAGAYSQIIASLPSAICEIEVGNSTGVPIILATGGAGSETDILIIPSTGLTRQAVCLPSGTRLAVKSLKGLIDSGFVTMNSFA